jgi:DHA2 family multidrug resistance protein
MSASSIAVPNYSATAVPRAVNPWIVALAVVIPTFMEVLDTTIANVALRHIAGGLSAAVTDGEWVITSYLAANAIILPISGWLSIRLGRRNYFLLSILVFTIASTLCGMATSLNMLIFSRILQGLAGGGLQPSSQGVLLDAFQKKNKAPLRRSSESPRCSRLSLGRLWAATSQTTTVGDGFFTLTCRLGSSRS